MKPETQSEASMTLERRWKEIVKLTDQLRDIAFQRGRGLQSDEDVEDARIALLVSMRALLGWAPPMIESRMSESAAVTPMTWEHWDSVSNAMHGSPTLRDRANLQEIAANIRSQVSGETVNVPRSELEWIAERIDRGNVDDALAAIRLLVTPAPKGEER